MKTLILSLLLLANASVAFADETTQDLRVANNISCTSNAIGNFYLADLNSNPVVVASTTKRIIVTSRTKNSIAYSFRDYKGYDFKLIFNKIVKHEDIDGSKYQTLAGSFVNGHVLSEIECITK